MTAGILLVLSLVTFGYVGEARLPGYLEKVARRTVPALAILLPAAFFLAVSSPEATEPNATITLAYLGAVSLGTGFLTLGIGLIRGPKRNDT